MLRRFVEKILANPLGVACLFVLVNCLGCGDREAPTISAETSKFQAAKDDGTDVAPPKKPLREVTQGEPDAPEPPAKPNRSPQTNNGNDPADLAGESKPPRTGVSPPAIDPNNLPEGTPEELLAMLEALDGRQPRGTTREEMLADFRNTLTARVRLAEKLLAGKAPEEIRLEAAKQKLGALMQAAQIKLPGAENELLAFSKEISKDKAKSIARFGHTMLFQLELGEVADGNAETAKQTMETLKQVLAEDGPQDDFFGPAQQAIGAFMQGKFSAEATEACRLIGETYLTSKDPKTVDVAKQIMEVAVTLKADIPGKLAALKKDEPQAAENLREAVTKLLTSGNPGAAIWQVTSQAAQSLEHTSHYAPAAEIYAAIGSTFKDHAIEELATQATADATKGALRVGLVGKPFVVDGKLLDGKTFDWTQYKGKVVLVDFWATWCGPCLQEIPNIRRNFEKFHEHGFEVVGVNLDEDAGEVQEFFKVQKLPWPTVVSADPQAMGFDSPLAAKCGINSIPFIVLIGRDGKVLDLHVRGEQLEEKLSAIFEAPPAKPAVPEKPVEKDATGKTSSHGRAIRSDSGFVGAQDTKPTGTSNQPTTKAPTDKAPADKAVETTGGKPESKLLDLEGNPYSPREDLTPAELVDFLFNMQEKPKSIQARPGFVEAIVEAADRLLAAKGTDKQQLIAITCKCEALHKSASAGNEEADKQLSAFVVSLKDDARPKVANEVRFLLLERQVLDAEKAPVEKIPDVLAELKSFCEKEKLTARHLRLASASVQAVNRLEDGDAREKYFLELGGLYAKSESKELARYGKKLTKKPEIKQSDLVGKPLELKGTTVDGAAFDWASYRGKVVLVDFWATWCGPCLREIPNVKELHAKHKAKGFEVVGISIDADLEALGTFLEQNALPWTTLAGEESQELATKYGVRGIPTMMLIDRDGKVLGVSHRSADFETQIAKLLSEVKN